MSVQFSVVQKQNKKKTQQDNHNETMVIEDLWLLEIYNWSLKQPFKKTSRLQKNKYSKRKQG